jgi:PAS domain S-box-containing protein
LEAPLVQKTAGQENIKSPVDFGAWDVESPAFVAVLKGPDGIVEVFSPLHGKLWSKRNILGKPMRVAWPEFAETGFFENVDTVLSTGRPVLTHEFPGAHDRDSDGYLNKTYYNFVYQPLREAGHKLAGVTVVGIDVTAQVLARQKAQKNEEHLAQALSASQMGIWEWDIHTGDLYWSNELKEMFGMQPDAEISYDLFLSKLVPKDRARMQSAVETAMLNGRAYKIEHQVVWPDGSTHWLLGQGKTLLKDGKPVRMLGTTINIDDRKEAEQKLRETERRFRTVADTAPVLIWIIDAGGSVEYVNRQWHEFTGAGMEASSGDAWINQIYETDRQHTVDNFKRHFLQKKPFEMQFRLRHHSNEYRWVLAKGSPRFSEDHEFLGYIGTCSDVHELKQAMAQQRKLEASTALLKAERAQLLALNTAKDDFISLASHQLRTPATGVKQYIGMLIEGYGGLLSDDQQIILRTAYRSNERQLKIIDDLLRVAHVDAGRVVLKKEQCDIVKLVSEVVAEERSVFEQRNQAVHIKGLKKNITAHVDIPRIRMVLENIVDNATKYTPEGKQIRVTIADAKDTVRIRIKDEGVGIAKADIPKLFHKFSRINNSLSMVVGGSGLGLYWAKEIIDLHKGAISINSELHRGSTFTITIPKGKA